MHYLVSVSGGAGSTIAAHRTVDKHGEADVTLAFADTNCEHESLYRSLDHMINVTLPNVEFIWLTNGGKTIWDVFNAEGFMKCGGSNCKASQMLKHRPLDALAQELKLKYGSVTRVSGLDITEQDRVARFDRTQTAKGFSTWHPLCDKPTLTSCGQIEQMQSWGYPEQIMYNHGYPHNNCGGGCVLAGVSQWVGLYTDFPEVFKKNMEEEKKFFEKTGYCILRDRRGGETKPLTLEQLEQRILSNDLTGLQDFRSTCGCMTPETDE